MLQMERWRKETAGLYLNKNIYDRRDLLIWPAFTPINSRLLKMAKKLGIQLSDDDMTDAEDVLFHAADVAFDELGAVFQEAGNSGQIRIRELRRTAVPMLKNRLTTSSLTRLLVHLRHKDDTTLRHSFGVGALSYMMGRWLKMSEDDICELTLAALLHDIGKLRIDRNILQKNGALTTVEYEAIKRHAVYGYEMLRNQDEVPESCSYAALRHHERYDGSGYPFRLKGKQIDLYSRIIAITDVFHAMSSKRPYKEPLPFFQVIQELHASTFDQFDPSLSLVFLSNMMESLIGTEVILTGGRRARIVAVNPNDLYHPLVRIDDEFIDLSKNKSIYIESYN